MKASKLVDILNILITEHGDLEVNCNSNGDINPIDTKYYNVSDIVTVDGVVVPTMCKNVGDRPEYKENYEPGGVFEGETWTPDSFTIQLVN